MAQESRARRGVGVKRVGVARSGRWMLASLVALIVIIYAAVFYLVDSLIERAGQPAVESSEP